MLRRTLAGLVALALLAGCSTSGANPSTTLSAWSKLYRSGAVRLLEDQSGYGAAVEFCWNTQRRIGVLSFDSAKTDSAKWMHERSYSGEIPCATALSCELVAVRLNETHHGLAHMGVNGLLS